MFPRLQVAVLCSGFVPWGACATNAFAQADYPKPPDPPPWCPVRRRGH